jgi:hypothetical protein
MTLINIKKAEMNKTLKIIGIVAGITILIGGLIGYYAWKRIQYMNKAQELADSVIENLDSESVYLKFPEKYFPKEQMESIIGGIRQNCEWKNRDGKYVDFFSQKNIGGVDQIAFIYEYHLKCDSLRFILSVNMEKEPELMGFYIEPLENENKMILFPEKQLKNR